MIAGRPPPLDYCSITGPSQEVAGIAKPAQGVARDTSSIYVPSPARGKSLAFAATSFAGKALW
jgi:hypothetical protein